MREEYFLPKDRHAAYDIADINNFSGLGGGGELSLPQKNLTWIRPEIAISDYAAALDVEFREEAMIGSILCLDGLVAPEVADSAPDLRVEVVPLRDGEGNDPKVFAAAVDILIKLVEEAPPVLVHCHAGLSRSPAVVASYLMRQEGLSAEEAIKAIAALREIHIAPGLARLLLAEK